MESSDSSNYSSSGDVSISSIDDNYDPNIPEFSKVMKDMYIRRKQIKKAVRKNALKIYMTSLVEEYKSFELENIRDLDILIDAVKEVLDVPSKNIVLFADEEKTKWLRFSEDYDDALDVKSSVSIYFQVKPNFKDIIKFDSIGWGDIGKIYKCAHFGKRDFFILKRFKDNIDKDLELKELMKEYEVYAKLGDHPRILKCNGYFRTDGASYVELEYLPGGSLRSYLKMNGPQKEPSIIRFASQILEGIDFLHGQNILHRDLKGSKILLDENLNVKLCGFRTSKIFEGISSADFKSNATKSNHGNPSWTAPEIIINERYGSSADIWSFGAIMVELITGKVPYPTLTTFQTIFRIGSLKKIEFMYPNGSSSKLKDFVACCLKPDPIERYSVRELLAHEFLN